ncbi:hypothetical protein [Hydrogenimonas urashimensis]|uniref:hypothetical protein n=1 Tax=Hydrogenimonas urashimensis TaxID=2740515 RepID=UPI0019159A9C|nr:hypothetical protein [Hydrogenimonas urashimensis]
MAFKLHIEGEGRKIGFYKINRLEAQGLEIDPDMEFDKENIRELFENINAFIESGELDEMDEAQSICTFNPEKVAITLDADNMEEIEISVDDVTLENINVDRKLELLERAKIGNIIFIRTEVGDAYWDIGGEGEANFDIEKVVLGYLDCSQSHDQYDIFREGYYDFLCDLVIPEEARYNGTKLEIDEHVLRPQQIWGELYIVRDNIPDHRKEFERVDIGGPMLLDTTATPEEFS